MEHSIALVTGTTSGLGYAAASMRAAKGCRQVIVPGRSVARVQETAAELAAETKKTGLHAAGAGLALDPDSFASVKKAGAEPVKRGVPIFRK
jgi:NAD(P)-dependent dehydrogenase (short-subunit alcohol dehydrogenase family)